ncbi:TWiK family of potassium channels protein 7-like [Hyalella azteca]|uniref:TWiK family of potassium channels protein 7-like n=1 Tax=Hyalella azteca TaxID=294128 RepID=A0A8B7PHR7_HYAAZ|nr:TWiK family of potassium channels protein 7-like [Hyalella azteca]
MKSNKIFQVLEQDLALQVARQTGDLLLQERLNFIKLIENSTPDNWTVFAKGLAQYEAALVAAADAGVQVLLQVQEDGSTAITTVSEDPWTYELSVFFAATVLTTIGYGDVAPVTVWGRVFCIGFALLGIPLSLSFIAATGDLLASFAAYLPIKSISAAIPKGKRRTLVAGLGTVSLLLGFIAVGGVMFHLLEDWQFLDAFYFCFITTTTIGFGDFVPSPDSLRYCTAYIMLGLAITSTVIELVRRQYAESWARMQELSSRLHGLSSPLAVALRRMALTGATEMDLDPELMRQLRDMNRALAEADHRDVEDDPWDELLIMAEKKKRITFVMYESAL